MLYEVITRQSAFFDYLDRIQQFIPGFWNFKIILIKNGFVIEKNRCWRQPERSAIDIAVDGEGIEGTWQISVSPVITSYSIHYTKLYEAKGNVSFDHVKFGYDPDKIRNNFV